MKIERIELHHIAQDLVHPFRTSFGTQIQRDCILVAVFSEGIIGWGEGVASVDPGYSYETVQTTWHILTDYLVPASIGRQLTVPQDLSQGFRLVRGHQMAKASLENAVWDLFAKAEGIPLSQKLGGVRDRVEVGVSIGIQPSLDDLLNRVDSFVQLGYNRIKIKIEPGWDLEPLTAIRQRYPDLKLMADANSAFSLDHVPLFRAMEPLNLLMIEQPLYYDDIYDHAKLQAQIETPICLDESIHSPHHARNAIELKACRVINMKVARVGGMNNALAIHQMTTDAGIALWCGGMLESGVGRATNLHLATLPNFVLPADISASDRYYAENVAEPAFVLNPEDSTITVPTGPGIGVEVLPDRVKKFGVRHEVFTA